ncbi:MAG: DNA cytosine methyltransferase, partial [Ruminococcus sp.]|nr:DNA cytosine methyltransferase [Ruminococcus sp.]
FDGISCGRLALERAGLSVEKYDAFETDKYAVSVSANNFPDIIQHGDVFNGDFTQFKDYDLLIGGSPCTYWSLAKKDREITSNGEGFRLFMQYVRDLKESDCKYFLYENNQSIHKNIKDAISEKLGVKPIMINSALVSAQQRKRCYWTNIPNVTQPDDKNIMLKNILESGISWQDKSYCMTASYDGAVIKNTLERKQRTMIAVPIRIGEYGKGGQGAKTGLYKIELPDGDYTIRKLTPVEAERLQTLPDNYTAGISNTQRYKCIGNAWTVNVIAHILGGLKNVE